MAWSETEANLTSLTPLTTPANPYIYPGGVETTPDTEYRVQTQANSTTHPHFIIPDNPYQDVDLAVDRYVTVVLFLIGIPGNILCFFVWIQPQMRNSSGIYLAALAIADLMLMCLLIPYELDHSWGVITLDYPVWCNVFPVMYLASQLMSPLLALAFTTERYISIYYPFLRKVYCTVRRAKIVVAGLVCFTFVISLAHAYIYKLRFKDEFGRIVCYPRESTMVGGIRSVYTIYTSSVDALYFLFGNIAIMVLNVLVIVKIKRNSEHRQLQLQPSTASQAQQNNTTTAATATLLSVSFYQIATTMPVSIAYSLFMYYTPENNYNTQEEGDKVYQDYFMFRHVLTLIKEYGLTHYAFNVFIYTLSGKTFRRTLKRIMQPSC